MSLCRIPLRDILRCLLNRILRLFAGNISVQFGFDRIPDHGKGFVDLAVELILTESVRQFHLDGRMLGLTAVFSLGRDFLAVRCVEFEHFVFLLKR